MPARINPDVFESYFTVYSINYSRDVMPTLREE